MGAFLVQCDTKMSSIWYLVKLLSKYKRRSAFALQLNKPWHKGGLTFSMNKERE